MDVDYISKIAELVKQKNLGEISYKDKNIEIVVKNALAPELLPIRSEGVKVVDTTSSDVKRDENTFMEIKSPMVGTFYVAKDPKSEPYVQIGDNVAEGQIVCVIEAMKVMNYIKATQSGVIRNILLGDGEAVEFDQVLFQLDNK